MCWSETRAETNDINLDGGHRFITALAGDGFVGVAILIHHRYENCVTDSRSYDGRVLAIDVCIEGVLFTIVSVYVPHAGYSHEDLLHV